MITKVKEIMVRTSFKFNINDALQETVKTFIDKKLEGALVFNHLDELAGVITEKELLRGVTSKNRTIEEITIPHKRIIDEEDSIEHPSYYENPIYPVKNKKNELTGYVTKKRLLEMYNEQTLENLSHLESIFNLAHFGLVSIDQEGYITSINPAAQKMAGTTKENAIGKFLNEIVAPTGLLEVLRTGEPQIEKYQVGKRNYIARRTPIIRDGKIFGAIGLFQDISDIENISQELNSVKNILNELDIVLESSYDAILITDNSGKIIKANKASNRMLGLDKLPETYEELRRECLETSIVSSVVENSARMTVLERNKKKNNLLMITATPVYNTDSDIHRVVINIRDITEIDNLRRTLDETRKHLTELESEIKFNKRFVAQSPSMKVVLKIVEQIAKVDSTVLLLGESGVGKEEIANLIHDISDRKSKPFVKINCGAIPEQLLESELFGYEAGAFTGANKNGKAGLFETADKGTIFLDEIGELPLQLQVKLLRVLQEKEFSRIGGITPKLVDVRILAATNQELKNLVEQGKFRKDLYYRLNVVPIQIPPLRNRLEEIPLLLALFQNRFNKQYKMEKTFSQEAIHALVHYHWPGNVRELINVVERLFVTTDQPIIQVKDINMVIETSLVSNDNNFLYINGIPPLKKAVDELEKQLLKKAFRIYKNTRKTADVLEINQSTVVRKMKKYLDENWYEEEEVSND